MKLKTNIKFTFAGWVGLLLCVVLHQVPLAQGQQSARGTYTTIDVPGATDTAECCSAILNINDGEQIVGGYLDTGGTGHGFLLSHGRFTTIDAPGSVYTEALGINSQGLIVGEYLDAAVVSHGFLLKHHVFSTVDFPGALNSFVNWINPENDMVGGYMDAAGIFHGFLVKRGNFKSFDYPGASNTFGLGINSRGDIVGLYIDSAGLNAHGFLLSRGRFISFDVPGSVTALSACNNFGGGATYTDGINDEGAIVGGYCGADNQVHGFLFTPEEGNDGQLGEQPQAEVPTLKGGFSTIDFPGAIFGFTSGINSEGKIVGGYQSVDGHYHGFLFSTRQEQVENQGQWHNSEENVGNAERYKTSESRQGNVRETIRRPIWERLRLSRSRASQAAVNSGK